MGPGPRFAELTERMRAEGVLATHGQKRDVDPDDITQKMSPRMTSRLTLDDLGINRNIAAAGKKLLGRWETASGWVAVGFRKVHESHGGPSMTRPLTSRQRDVLAFVRGYLDAHGYPPATREIAQELDITDTAAHGHLVACERKGHLRRAPGIARGIRLLDPPAKSVQEKIPEPTGIARGIRLLDPPGSGSRQDHHHASRTENAR